MITIHPTYLSAIAAIVGEDPHRFTTAEIERPRRAVEIGKEVLANSPLLQESQYQTMVRTMERLIAGDPKVCADLVEGPARGMTLSEYTEDGTPLHFIAFKR